MRTQKNNVMGRKLTRVFALVFWLLITVAHVQAQTQAAMNAQAREDFARADADLNKTYQAVLAKVRDTESKQKLRETQRAWIASRDAEAARAAGEADGGSMAPTLRYEKMTELTQERIKELKAMLDHGAESEPKPVASSVTAAPASGMGQSPPEASPSASASASEGENENENPDCPPSPDGKFAFVTNYDSDVHTIDLIDKRSGKKLQRIGEEDSEQAYWHVLWAPDSNRFALMTRLGHPIQGVDVYLRSGETFRTIELPKLPEANIPEKLKHGKHFPHVANLNWQTAEEWKKDGSLVVSIDTMIDGEGSFINATRTVVLGFDRTGKGRILKSAIKYETEESDPAVKAEKLETAGRTAQDKGDIDGSIAAYSRAIKLDPGDVGAYYLRGCANFIKRDWAKAVSDFQHHCDLRKEEKYQVFEARFYIWLSRARLGDREAADKELAPYMEGHPVEWSGGWHAKIGNFLLGRISEHDFLASLSDSPGGGWFYAGMKRLLNNDKSSAAEDFRKSVATADKESEEYQMAAAELKALSK
jgi:uncharacterized protein YecT (DUF1311 family)